MNPFVDHIAHHPAILADRTALSDDEQDELFEALNAPDLPDDCMTAEMADGFLTGCVLSPHAVDTAEWLEEVFGQASMPDCGGPEAKDRLLALVLRRWRDIQHAFTPEVAERALNQGSEPMFTPLIGHVDPDEVVHPVQLDADERRVGEWLGRDWAVGFFSAIQRDETWWKTKSTGPWWPPSWCFSRATTPGARATTSTKTPRHSTAWWARSTAWAPTGAPSTRLSVSVDTSH
jgi:Uncharacterised protein family (UPF0149)